METLSIIVMINICLTVIFFLYKGVYKNNMKKAFLLSFFILMVPIVGAVFLLAAECTYFIFYKGRDKLLNPDELGFSQQRTKMIIGNDLEKEADTVPIEEALRISDTMAKRQVFLDVLKRPDVEDYILGIQDAVNQKDSEIVHYAASYISDAIEKYMENERVLRALCDQDDSSEVLLTYLHFVIDVLDKHLFSKPEQMMYVHLFEGYLEKLYHAYPQKVDGYFISKVVFFLKECGDDTGNIDKWINRAEEHAEQDITAAKEVLKYYYGKNDKEGFYSFVDKIKKSSLVLDSELLEWIRFFS